MGMYERHIFVCENERSPDDSRGCCKSKNSSKFLQRLKELIKEAGLAYTVRANSSGCLGQCSQGACIVVYPEGIWYRGVTVEDADEIFLEHIQQGRPVKRLILIRG